MSLRMFILVLLTFILTIEESSVLVHARTKRSARHTDKQAAMSSIPLVVGAKRISLSTLTLNGQRYTSVEWISNALQSKAADHIGWNNCLVRAAPGSFFVSAQNFLGTRFRQLSMPALLRANKTLVPIPQFFDALCSLDLCSVDVKTRVYRFERQTTHQKPDASQHQYLEPKAPTVKDGDTLLTPHQPSAPRLRYQLPNGLKRRELDDDKMRDGALILDNESVEAIEEFASLTTDISDSPARIGAVYHEVVGDVTKIHLTSSKKISDKCELDFKSKVITLRITDALNQVSSLDNIRKLNFAKVRTYLERGAQVYEFTLKRSDREVELVVLNSNHVVIVISPSDSKPVETSANKWNLDVIVIDAGHGGRDHGAESVTKKSEKDITLVIAKKLSAQLTKLLPKTKVVLTRSDDTFIELDKRGELANRAQGKLFISVHCNSMPSKPHPAHGFETYVLSPAKSDNAARVAAQENSVIKLEERSERYKQMEDDQLILATLAQNSFVKLSQTFASYVQKELDQTTTMENRGVSQAGFLVLIGASMPAVLVEVGFLSNKQDEKYLTSAKGQLSIADGIARAVKQYSEFYTRMLKVNDVSSD